jgi:predicted secreted protein
MSSKPVRTLIFVAAIVLTTSFANAQVSGEAEPKGTKINLDAHASMEVDNDVMRATLFVEMEDSDATRLADKINRATNDSIKLAKEFTGLRVKTAGYTTYPVTDKNRIVRWRSRSEIILESEDFRRMAEAIGKLQAIMQLGAVDFSISPAARARAEEALTQTAIAAFLRRAELVAKGFKGPGFNVLEATVSADGGLVPPPRPMMMKSIVAEAAPAPEFQGGTRSITVTVNGTILIPR